MRRMGSFVRFVPEAEISAWLVGLNLKWRRSGNAIRRVRRHGSFVPTAGITNLLQNDQNALNFNCDGLKGGREYRARLTQGISL
jgi:hypothetical protein